MIVHMSPCKRKQKTPCLSIVPAKSSVPIWTLISLHKQSGTHARVRLQVCACAQDLLTWRSSRLNLLLAAHVGSNLSIPNPAQWTLAYILCVHSSAFIFSHWLRLKVFFSLHADDGLQNGPGLRRNSQGKQCT